MSFPAIHRRSAPFLFLAMVFLGSCQEYRGELYDRIEGLRLASIKIYSAEELGAVEREALLAEFRTTDVSIFRIQERRDALLELHQRESRIREKVLAERRKRALADDVTPSDYEGAPIERDYWKRRRARNRKD
ncbi:MAG: hypothetical protein VCD16_05965 [Planctomycetota bacterium]